MTETKPLDLDHLVARAEACNREWKNPERRSLSVWAADVLAIISELQALRERVEVLERVLKAAEAVRADLPHSLPAKCSPEVYQEFVAAIEAAKVTP